MALSLLIRTSSNEIFAVMSDRNTLSTVTSSRISYWSKHVSSFGDRAPFVFNSNDFYQEATWQDSIRETLPSVRKYESPLVGVALFLATHGRKLTEDVNAQDQLHKAAATSLPL